MKYALRISFFNMELTLFYKKQNLKKNIFFFYLKELYIWIIQAIFINGLGAEYTQCRLDVIPNIGNGHGH